MSVEKPEIEQQATFGEGGIKTSDEVDTDLEDWGLVENEREQESQVEEAVASEWGRDDREVEEEMDEGEQSKLFADVDDDQQTLTGKRASTQSMW